MWKIETRQTKPNAPETRQKNIRKMPVQTHFQRIEIKTQKDTYVEGQNFFEKEYLENF